MSIFNENGMMIFNEGKLSEKNMFNGDYVYTTFKGIKVVYIDDIDEFNDSINKNEPIIKNILNKYNDAFKYGFEAESDRLDVKNFNDWKNNVKLDYVRIELFGDNGVRVIFSHNSEEFVGDHMINIEVSYINGKYDYDCLIEG